MAEKKFQPGDVVELNSGSIKMTVWFVNNDGTVFVYYYNPDTKLIQHQIELPASILKLAE